MPRSLPVRLVLSPAPSTPGGRQWRRGVSKALQTHVLSSRGSGPDPTTGDAPRAGRDESPDTKASRGARSGGSGETVRNPEPHSTVGRSPTYSRSRPVPARLIPPFLCPSRSPTILTHNSRTGPISESTLKRPLSVPFPQPKGPSLTDPTPLTTSEDSLW